MLYWMSRSRDLKNGIPINGESTEILYNSSSSTFYKVLIGTAKKYKSRDGAEGELTNTYL
jgi:hypothetical protein